MIKKIKESGIYRVLINRETIVYGIVGAATTIFNIVLFKLLLLGNMEYKTANFIAIVLTKLFAYIGNKNIVFKSHTANFILFLKEFIRFLFARGFTALVDFFGLIFWVEVLNLNKMAGKILINILVIILNYVIGKKHVFKDSANTISEGERAKNE